MSPFPPRLLPLVDTHAHLNLDDFSADLNDVVVRSKTGLFPPIRGRQVEDSVFRPYLTALVCPGVDLESSRRALELSERFAGFLFAAAGIHPNYTAQIQPGDWAELERLAFSAATPESPLFGRLVALGETGLDRYWDDAPFETQRESFVRHLELGRRANLPVLIHCRDANDDLSVVLRDFCANLSDVSTDSASVSRRVPLGVVHSFSGTPEQADEWVELGFYLGFGGFVTYPNRKFANVWEAARRVPSDRMLLETDCPFLTPHPFRGKLDRNEPLATAFVAKRLAELRGVSVEEIIRQTTENAVNLFGFSRLTSVPEIRPNP